MFGHVRANLDGQRIILFVTSPFRPNAHAKNMKEHRIEPFLPDSCRYSGLYLCVGQASDGLLRTLRIEAEKHPNDEQAALRLSRCEESIGHPDEDELQEARQFVAEILKINV